jgi:integrase
MSRPGYTVELYERPGNPFWWARCYVEGEGGKVRRWSTRVLVGTRKKESARTARRLAEERAERFAAEVQAVAHASSDTSLDAVAERMLKHKTAEGRRKRAVDTHAENLDANVVEFFGASRDVRTIRRADLEAFKRHLHGLGRAPTTINNNLTAIRQVLKYAWQVEELLEAVPAVPNVRVPNESKGRALTADQVAALLAAVDPRYPEAREWLTFIANTGLRKTEALSIKWTWVDWQGRCIRIPAEERKGAARRVPVPLNDTVLALLRDREKRKRQPRHGRVWFQQKHDGARNSAVKRAGIEGRVRTHDLRHTLGSLAHAAGASLVDVRDLLGHTTLAMVSRYAHSYEDRLQEVAARVQIAPGAVSSAVSTERRRKRPNQRERKPARRRSPSSAK